MDETWLYHYDPETKQQSMEWRHSVSPRLKKFRVQKSTGKVLASIFWDQDGILLIDYLPKGQTINTEALLISAGATEGHFEGKNVAGRSLRRSCSCTTMPQLTGHLQPRRNWPTWASNVFVTHPNSSDLALSDYRLFSGLKKQLKGRHFSSDAEVIAAAETGFDGQFSELFF